MAPLQNIRRPWPQAEAGYPLDHLTLVETRALKSGVLVNTYRRSATD